MGDPCFGPKPEGRSNIAMQHLINLIYWGVSWYTTAYIALHPCAKRITIPAQTSEQLLTVVELYTSQGCSSCPATDAYLGQLAKRSDILHLSFHADYWN